MKPEKEKIPKYKGGFLCKCMCYYRIAKQPSLKLIAITHDSTQERIK